MLYGKLCSSEECEEEFLSVLCAQGCADGYSADVQLLGQGAEVVPRDLS